MKSLIACNAVLLLGSLWLVGCGGDDEEELPDVECPDPGDVPSYDEVAIFNKCTSCHSSTKKGDARAEAPEGVDFDNEAAAQKSAMKAAHEVYEGEMPPPASGIKVTEAEKQALYEWALCSD